MKKENICVCIPTFKRPYLLKKLIAAIEEQKTDGIFRISIVVVDNDRKESARDVVKLFRSKGVDIQYENEPVQNIAMARNRAVKVSRGEYIVFIDDDEIPAKEWLYDHYRIIKSTGADGVLGPVKPQFDSGAPDWLKKSGICSRPSYPTGKLLHAGQTRTGNVMFKRNVFTDTGLIFDPAYGLTGGEDTDFFRRAMALGLRFVWCQEASVSETVPPERWKRTFYLKRAFLRGRVNHMAVSGKNSVAKSLILIKSILAFTAYTVSLPVILSMGDRIMMRAFDKYFHHIGRLATAIGLDVVDKR